jgi:hypothetical protein
MGIHCTPNCIHLQQVQQEIYFFTLKSKHIQTFTQITSNMSLFQDWQSMTMLMTSSSTEGQLLLLLISAGIFPHHSIPVEHNAVIAPISCMLPSTNIPCWKVVASTSWQTLEILDTSKEQLEKEWEHKETAKAYRVRYKPSRSSPPNSHPRCLSVQWP